MSGILRKDLAKDYGLTLSWRYAEVEFLGLPKLKDSGVYRLEHIYVPLRLCRDWKERFDASKTLHVPQALQEQRRLVVLGDPGSGKSTLVKVLTYAFGEAKANPYKRACGELIPIPIILRTYNTRRWETPGDMLRDFIATLDPDIRDEITVDWLLTHLESGRAILLVDGVDEVGSRADREHLRDRIVMPLLGMYPKARAFITSRVVGYDEVPFDFIAQGDEQHPSVEVNAKGWYVAPFNDEEIKQFVTRWYALRESFPDKQTEGVDSLMRALNQNDRVKRLAHNPQLLTLVALIHRVTANLPSGRVELYDKIVEAYLETIQVFRKLGTPARLDEMKRWLANVGWKMQVRRDEIQASGKGATSSTYGEELLVTRGEIRAWLEEVIEKERGAEDAPATAERFLDYVARRSGLLVPRSPSEFSFAHLTFQEYFAAFELRGRVRRFDRLAEECVRLVEKRHWHETLNLLFEMLTEFPGACDELFEEIISSKQHSDSVAEFVSLLLLDEQSGLSVVNQEKGTRYALETTCDNGNYAIYSNLRQLNERSSTNWVVKPLTYTLQHGEPQTLRSHFFWVGSHLVANWQDLVCEAIEKRSQENWSESQVAAMTLVCRGSEAVRWATARLSLPHWLSPLNRSETSLVFELSEVLLQRPCDSGRHLVLTQIALVCALDTLLLLRIELLELRSPARKALFAKGLSRRLQYSLFYDGSPQTRNPHAPTEIRWLMRFFNFGSYALRKVAETARRYRQVVGKSELMTDDELLSFGIAATRIGLSPALKGDLEISLGLLPAKLSSSDDWTTLVHTWFLLCLGSGTPALCKKFNDLLDQAVMQPEDFTFPASLKELAQSGSFLREEFPASIRLLFRHEGGDPFLRPEWFDAGRPESSYFLMNARQLIFSAKVESRLRTART